MNVLRWILALALAGLFLFMASFKFMPELTGASNPVFPTIAANTGIALVEPYLRWITGALEILTGLLLIAPKTRMAGASLALCIMIGAIVSHVTPILGIEVDGSAFIFYMAIVMLVLTLLVLFLSRRAPHVRVAN